MSKREACRVYEIHWATLKKILAHEERRATAGAGFPGVRPWNRCFRSSVKFLTTTRRLPRSSVIQPTGSGNGRDQQTLEGTASAIRTETGAEVVAVPGDIGEPNVQRALVGAFPQIDILVNNNGGPPLRDFRELDRKAMEAGVAANMLNPIELVQQVIDGMVARRFGRIVNITSSSVKMPLAGLDLSSGARAGLTGFLAGVARSVAHANVTINFLLPGAFETDRLRSSLQTAAAKRGMAREAVTVERREAIPAKRFGEPAEFGTACAFLCSTHAGYITGQSILIDGGAFPGIL